MAYDRVSRETAELVPLPPHTWYVRTVGWLLEQEKVQENIKNVPENKPLKEALIKEGIRSPFLCMPNWYPIAGSQRMRALVEVVKTNPEFYEKKINAFEILFTKVSIETIGTSAIQSRACAGVASGTFLFALPGSPSACKDAWDKILCKQFDYRNLPCNFVEILPRLEEHKKRK